jgi:hypothetical protein
MNNPRIIEWIDGEFYSLNDNPGSPPTTTVTHLPREDLTAEQRQAAHRHRLKTGH